MTVFFLVLYFASGYTTTEVSIGKKHTIVTAENRFNKNSEIEVAEVLDLNGNIVYSISE